MTNLDAEIARRIAAKSKYAPPLPPTKEELRERLVTIFRLVKSAHDEEDSAAADALLDEKIAAENALVALVAEGDDIYMPAAKLIIATAGEIFDYVNSRTRDTRLNAEAALGALRLFGLVDVYRECFPRDGCDAAEESSVNMEPLHETLKGQLRDVLLAWKAYHDCGEDDDTPIGAPLFERGIAAEEKIRAWNSDEPEVGIAKLITSMTAVIYRDIGRTCDEAMAANAALAGLRWFGLEELYYEAFPVDVANIKKALLEAEADAAP